MHTGCPAITSVVSVLLARKLWDSLLFSEKCLWRSCALFPIRLSDFDYPCDMVIVACNHHYMHLHILLHFLFYPIYHHHASLMSDGEYSEWLAAQLLSLQMRPRRLALLGKGSHT